MEDHNNEKRPRQQGRSNYTRRAPRANNNNQNRMSFKCLENDSWKGK